MAHRRGQQHRSNQGPNQPQSPGNGRSERTWYNEPRNYGGGYGQNRQRFGDYSNDWESERSYNEPEYAPGLGEPGWRKGGYGQGSYGQGWYGQNRPGQHAGKGPKGYRRSDDRIREEISDELTDHPDIDASEIEIEVKDGEVTLTGTVDSRDAKRMTEDVVERSSGVTHVSNQLRVSNGLRMSGGSSGESSATSAHGRRGSR
jgi:hypothetical protein